MNQNCLDILTKHPVIAAVKTEEDIERAIKADNISIVFTLYGEILKIPTVVEKIKTSGKICLVDVDLIDGLAPKEAAAIFAKEFIKADGIVSTKPAVLRKAKEIGLITVFRNFAFDSIAIESIERQAKLVTPDFLEVLPGIAPKIIKRLVKLDLPLIASGLVTETCEIEEALKAGAVGVTSSTPEVWELNNK